MYIHLYIYIYIHIHIYIYIYIYLSHTALLGGFSILPLLYSNTTKYLELKIKNLIFECLRQCFFLPSHTSLYDYIPMYQWMNAAVRSSHFVLFHWKKLKKCKSSSSKLKHFIMFRPVMFVPMAPIYC